MEKLRPMFTYYGAKHRLSIKYPKPARDSIVEPFAGSAAYSLRYYQCKVSLNDADPIIAGIWKYLINASVREIMRLPALVNHIDDVHAPQEAKWLIGFWLGAALRSPVKKPSVWMRMRDDNRTHASYWGEHIKSRLARQCELIRHWRVTNKDWHQLSIKKNATYFVDPPYQISGKYYRYPSNRIDYYKLATWCRCINNVIVCEQQGADWLPFSTLCIGQAMGGKYGKKTTAEVVWQRMQ